MRFKRRGNLGTRESFGERGNGELGNSGDPRNPGGKPRNYMEYALKLLGQRKYSTAKLTEKLTGKGAAEKEIKQIVKRLKEWKYLDDRDYAKSYIQSRCNLNPRGEYLLKWELKRKGLENKVIEKALAEANLDEMALAQDLIKRKAKSLQRLPKQKQRERLMYTLRSRGFKPEIIFEVLPKME